MDSSAPSTLDSAVSPYVINLTEALCATSWCAPSRVSTLTPSNADEPREQTRTRSTDNGKQAKRHDGAKRGAVGRSRGGNYPTTKPSSRWFADGCFLRFYFSSPGPDIATESTRLAWLWSISLTILGLWPASVTLPRTIVIRIPQFCLPPSCRRTPPSTPALLRSRLPVSLLLPPSHVWVRGEDGPALRRM